MIMKIDLHHFMLEIRDKYEVFEIHDLLQSVGLSLFKSDDEVIRFMSNHNHITKDDYHIIFWGKGWRINRTQYRSEFPDINDLRKSVELYNIHRDREGMMTENRVNEEVMDKQMHMISKEFDKFMCYLSNNYYSTSIIFDYEVLLQELYNKVSEKFYEGFTDFQSRKDFYDLYKSYLQDIKKRERDDVIDSVL